MTKPELDGGGVTYSTPAMPRRAIVRIFTPYSLPWRDPRGCRHDSKSDFPCLPAVIPARLLVITAGRNFSSRNAGGFPSTSLRHGNTPNKRIISLGLLTPIA